jgi:hypothetical protein
MGGQTLVGAVVSEGVEEAESEVGMAAALRHLFTAPLDQPITTPHESKLIHYVRTQHFLLGCACSRQTTLLAHGYPARSGVGAASTHSLAFL